MNLHTVLFGQFTAPPVKRTIRHRILQEGSKPLPRYVAKPAKPNQMEEFADKMFELVKHYPGICSVELSEKLGKHISYIYKLRDTLFGRGSIEGIKGKPLRRGGPMTTLFYVRDHAPR